MPIPSKITAGDDVSWTDGALPLGDGSFATSSTHALVYSLRGPIKAAGVDVTCGAAGQGWQGSLGASASGALNSGPAPLRWFWSAVAVALVGGKRKTVAQGQTTVAPSLAALTAGQMGFDGRTPAERDLAAVNAEISARISGGMTISYTIAGRSLQKEPTEVLLTLQSRLRMTVSREKTAAAVANGLGNPGRTMVRFTR